MPRRLLFDGLPLVIQVLLGHLQRPHAVGFEEQRQVNLVFGHDLEVQGAVVIGGAIHAAAVGEDQIEMLACAHIFRAFEHHVFEQVGEAGTALPLVAGADLIAHGNAEYRGIVVLRYDYAETVVERGIGKFDRWYFRGRKLGDTSPVTASSARIGFK
jgi:hypothetical protein